MTVQHGTMSWKISLLDREVGWDARWDEFAARVGGSILQGSVMAQAALRWFGAAGVHLGVAEDGAGVAAMALLQSKRPGVWGLYEMSQLPLGLWLQRPDVELSSALAGLMRVLPGYPVLFEGFNYDPGMMARPADDGGLRTLDHILTGAVDMAETAEAFDAGMDRDELRKIAKRVRKATSELGEVRLERLTEADAMEAGVADYAAVESLGWKGAAGTALTVGGSQAGFYQQVLTGYARQGQARIYKLYLGPQLAAVQLAVVADSVAIFLKSCHDESLGRFGPGLMLKHRVFHSLIEHDAPVRRVEFYGPLISAQLAWRPGMRRMYHLNYYRWSWVAKLHTLARSRAPDAASRESAGH